MKYGDILKKLRTSKGLSQQELANRLSINRSTYARYETSSTQPDFDTLKQLADYFEVSTDELLGYTVDKPTQTKSTENVAFEAFRNDPNLEVFYKELPESDEEKVQQLKDFWEFINKKK